MKKIYGLFNNQEEAGNAIEALLAAGFEDAPIHTIEDSTALETETVAVAPIHEGGYGAATALPFPNFLSDLNGSEAREFIHRSLKNGGGLIVIETVDDDEFAQIKRILEDEGGQITT